MITTLQYGALKALRDAAALRREPGPLTPDGHEHFFSVEQLYRENRVFHLATAERALTQLHRQELVSFKTLHTVRYYGITGDGIVLLNRIEMAAGAADCLALERELDQAREDIKQAQRRESALLARIGSDTYILLTSREIVEKAEVVLDA